MKKKNKEINEPNVPDKAVILTTNSVFYIVAFVAIIIFTQALRNRVSAVIFYSFLVFVPLNVLFAFLSTKGLRVSLDSSETTVAKHTPFSYVISISNESILPVVFAEAYMYIPDKEAVRTTVKKVFFSMPPSAATTITNTVSFPFRGTYDIGLETIYVYDFFKTVKFKVDLSERTQVFAVPKRLKSDMVRSIVSSDSSGITSRSPFSPEKTEVDDIRDYRAGDSLKSIHWKLSSKSENFIVREYAQGSVKTNLIFVDLSARSYEKITKAHLDGEEPNPYKLNKSSYLYDMNEYCIDGTVECAVSVVSKYLMDGEACVLIWYDSRSASGIFAFQLTTENEFDMIFKLFAGAPIAPAEKSLKDLRDVFQFWSEARRIYITSALDHDAVLSYASIAESDSSTAYGNSDMIYFSSAVRMDNPSAWRTYVEDCGMQLQKKGLILKEFNAKDYNTGEEVAK